jgi:hypothetical protein
VIAGITALCPTQETTLQTQAQRLQQDLAQLMRRFGRQCRGIGKVFVTLVRQTARHVLERGAPVLSLAPAARAYWPDAPPLSGDHRARLDTQLATALKAHQRIEAQSRRLTRGQAWRDGKIVTAYDPTIAPLCTGKSNRPTQFGPKPGSIAAPAAGFLFALPVPVGNPSDASSVAPLVAKVGRASARGKTRPVPTLPALAGDLARNDAALRQAWHARGILTVGSPQTVDPLPPWPTPEDVLRSLDEADLHHIRTPSQVHLAYACGYSRPVVESLIASLRCRGAGRLTCKGHHGAIVQMGMVVMAHNAATLVRLHA